MKPFLKIVIALTIMAGLQLWGAGLFVESAQSQQLHGDAAHNFLAREGILDQLSANVPPQGRNFLEPQPVTSSDVTTANLFGGSVAVSGSTVVVGAEYASINSKPSQGAAYVFVKSNGSWIQQQKLVANDGQAGDFFGGSVAVDGNTAVVGAYWADVNGKHNQGAAYVFTRSGSTWSQQQKLVAGDGAAGDWFGFSVDVHGDTAVAGAYFDEIDGKAQQGSTYVFTRSGTTWSEQQKLTAADGLAADNFGVAVAVDGHSLIVGANQAKVGVKSFHGAAYIFTRSGSTWSQQQKLVAADGQGGDAAGKSVAISGDTAVVGAPGSDPGGKNFAGAAYVFVRSGSSWSQQGKLTASDGAATDSLGSSVAVDGDTAVAGAYFAMIGGTVDQGAAYVFSRSGTTWSQQQKLADNGGAFEDWFGLPVAISGDIVAVGAQRADIGGLLNAGQVLIAERPPMPWPTSGNNVASDGAAGDWLGFSVSIAGDTAVVGAPHTAIGGKLKQGAAYVFIRNGPVWVQQKKLTANDGAAFDNFGTFVSLDGDTAVIGAYEADVDGKMNQGAAYVFTRSGSVWTQQKKLTANDGAADGYFGWSLSLDGDTVVIGAYLAKVGANAGQGAAYVFTRAGNNWSQQQKLTANDGAKDDNFGIATALAGNRILIGAVGTEIDGTENQGAVYYFERSGTTWSQKQKLLAGDGLANDWFGFSAALDGNTAVIGAILADINGTKDQGAAYVFTRTGSTWNEQKKLFAPDGGEFYLLGTSVAVRGNVIIAGAYLSDIAGNNAQGAAYVFRGSGSAWILEQKLLAANGRSDDQFGWSVSLSGNTAAVGAPQVNVGIKADQGKVYFFDRKAPVFAVYMPVITK